MSFARDLVGLENDLRTTPGIDPFASLSEGGLESVAAFSDAEARIAPMISTSALAVRLCVQALRIQYDEFKTRLLDAELVATLPSSTPGIARPTESVVREMVANAKSEIILLGYELSHTSLISEVSSAAARGVEVIMICDRARESGHRILERWPSNLGRPRVYHDKERTGALPYASMHAKCLLVDGWDLLVTSANFTLHGMQGNIEIGVRLAGPPASEARKIFSYLVTNQLVEATS